MCEERLRPLAKIYYCTTAIQNVAMLSAVHALLLPEMSSGATEGVAAPSVVAAITVVVVAFPATLVFDCAVVGCGVAAEDGGLGVDAEGGLGVDAEGGIGVGFGVTLCDAPESATQEAVSVNAPLTHRVTPLAEKPLLHTGVHVLPE
jgi:hypothetical protein